MFKLLLMDYDGIKIWIKISGQVKSICPVSHEVDYHYFEIHHIPRNKLIEVLKLKEIFNKWDELEFTSEEWVNRIYSLLHDLNPIKLNVKVVDNSLGFRVEVSL